MRRGGLGLTLRDGLATFEARLTSDAELLPVAAEPQPIEIGELFSTYHDRVSRWVRRLGGPSVDAEDAVQEVLLRAHSRLWRFKGREKIAVWLYRVTENVVLHQRRRLWRQRRVIADGREQDQDHCAANVAMESAADMEERRQELDLIYKALDRMRERDRTLIILFELEELSGLEIAELKGVKVATVWVWLHRARAEFRRQVAELGQTSFYLRELNR